MFSKPLRIELQMMLKQKIFIYKLLVPYITVKNWSIGKRRKSFQVFNALILLVYVTCLNFLHILFLRCSMQINFFYNDDFFLSNFQMNDA